MLPIIVSDGWSSCKKINELPEGYVHHVVNHSIECKNSDGSHTNGIEGKWRPLRVIIPQKMRNVEKIIEPLLESKFG